MKSIKTLTSLKKGLTLSALLIATLSMAACGQKGPLEVEAEPIFQEEPQETTK